MKKKLQSNIFIRNNYFLIILFIILFSNVTLVQAKKLDIIITDLNDKEINEIYENEYFKLSVLDFDQNDTPYLINVDIEFNGFLYNIDENAEIILQAPEVDSDRLFEINVSKEGYNSINKTLTILNNDSQVQLPKLFITPEFYTVEAGKQFAIFVKDSDENPIFGVDVAIQSFGSISITDDAGKAWLTAPENKESVTIIAQKNGYIGSKIDIKVNIPEYWWVSFIKSPYFPVFIAVIILFMAIIFVNHKQKKSVFNRAQEITNETTLEKHDIIKKTTSSLSNNGKEKSYDQKYHEYSVRIKPDRDPKVEEIRISRPRKEKEIVSVESKEEETEKIINRKKIQRHDNNWFEGTEDIRYEIDKLTGKVDEDGIDKWYEGIDTLREKIDEKVKKKDKKKE
jgi:hypothetical protein